MIFVDKNKISLELIKERRAILQWDCQYGFGSRWSLLYSLSLSIDSTLFQRFLELEKSINRIDNIFY